MTQTPKQKALELYLEFSRYTDSEFTEFHHKYTKECVIKVVNEILASHYKVLTGIHPTTYDYFIEVKKELENL